MAGTTVGEALAGLTDLAASGELASLCERFDVEIVTLFGSALTSPDPGDVDVAIGFRAGSRRDVLGVINALGEAIPGDHLDVMDLDRAGPVAQMAAMYGSKVLYEFHPSVSTEREIRAFMSYQDTQWLRDLQTECLRR